MSQLTNEVPRIQQLSSAGTRRSVSRRQLLNRGFFWFCLFVTSVAVVVLTVLLLTITMQGWDGLGTDFLQNYGSRKPESAGIKAALWGSVWICGVCGLVALPVGVATAIYLEEFASQNRLTSFIRTNISNLAGVPSIVYGIIGLTIFARLFGLPGIGSETDPGLDRIDVVGTYYASDGATTLASPTEGPRRPAVTGDRMTIVEETDVSLVEPGALPLRLVPRLRALRRRSIPSIRSSPTNLRNGHGAHHGRGVGQPEDLGAGDRDPVRERHHAGEPRGQALHGRTLAARGGHRG